MACPLIVISTINIISEKPEREITVRVVNYKEWTEDSFRKAVLEVRLPKLKCESPIKYMVTYRTEGTRSPREVRLRPDRITGRVKVPPMQEVTFECITHCDTGQEKLTKTYTPTGGLLHMTPSLIFAFPNTSHYRCNLQQRSDCPLSRLLDLDTDCWPSLSQGLQGSTKKQCAVPSL